MNARDPRAALGPFVGPMLPDLEELRAPVPGPTLRVLLRVWRAEHAPLGEIFGPSLSKLEGLCSCVLTDQRTVDRLVEWIYEHGSPPRPWPVGDPSVPQKSQAAPADESPLTTEDMAATVLQAAHSAGVRADEYEGELGITQHVLFGLSQGVGREPEGLRQRAVAAIGAWRDGRRVAAKKVNAPATKKPAPVLTQAPSQAPATQSAPPAASVPTTLSNAEFMQAIFGAPAAKERPYTVSLAGDPDNAPGWGGSPWEAGVDIERPKLNNYLSLASYRPDAAGDYHRRKVQCVAVHALLLDDVGTKASPLSRLAAAPPSWVIETSPGNFQAGYIMAAPINDMVLADNMQGMLVATGLCDPGAMGPSARLARLPVGINGKAKYGGWTCRLVDWAPQRRYSPQELVSKLQLTAPAAKQAAGVARAQAAGVPIASTDNEVVQALKAKGMYKRLIAPGQHDITCPLVKDHTGGVDHGTAYFEPDTQHPIGGMSCQHSHDVNITTLREVLGLRDAQMRGKPIIALYEGQDSFYVDQLGARLGATGHFFRLGSTLVRVSGNDPERPLVAQTKESLAKHVDALVTFEAFDSKSKHKKVVNVPPRLVAMLAGADEWPGIPQIKTLALAPVIRADGTLMNQRGFDPATKNFGLFDPASFVVPDKPTQDDAVAALTLLRGVLEEVAFATPEGEPAALAALVGAALRPGLDFAPLAHINANEPGTGKSYLSQLILAMGGLMETPPTPFPADKEEMAKLLVAKAREGAGALLFDNIDGPVIAHPPLCTLITHARVGGRLLGFNTSVDIASRMTVITNGNQSTLGLDLRRRGLTIELDAQCETPSTREFKADPLEHMRNEWPRYTTAALTIVRAWIEAGRPHAPGAYLSGFRQWCDLVAQPLMWLGVRDVAAIMAGTITQDDPQRELLGALLPAVYAAFGSQPVKVKEIVSWFPPRPAPMPPGQVFGQSQAAAQPPQRGDDVADLREVVELIVGGKFDRNQVLGLFLAKNRNRRTGGFVLRRHDSKHATASWYVEKVVTN